MAMQPVVQTAPLDANHVVSYPTKGYKLDDQGRVISNGHSQLVDISGKDVWVHGEQHWIDGGRVQMPLWHARDLGLPLPKGIEEASQPTESLSPGSQQQQPSLNLVQPATNITQPSTAGEPTSPGAPSKLPNTADAAQDPAQADKQKAQAAPANDKK